jgi:hypothetical protein
MIQIKLVCMSIIFYCSNLNLFTAAWWESQKVSDDLKDQGVNGRMGSEWISGRLAGGVEWIQLAKGNGRWKSLLTTVMNLRVLAPRS